MTETYKLFNIASPWQKVSMKWYSILSTRFIAPQWRRVDILYFTRRSEVSVEPNMRCIQTSQRSVYVPLSLTQRSVLPEHTHWSFLLDQTSRGNALGWATRGLLRDIEKHTFTRYRGCWDDRLTRCTFTFYLVAIVLAARASQITLKIEPSFNQYVSVVRQFTPVWNSVIQSLVNFSWWWSEITSGIHSVWICMLFCGCFCKKGFSSVSAAARITQVVKSPDL